MCLGHICVCGADGKAAGSEDGLERAETNGRRTPGPPTGHSRLTLQFLPTPPLLVPCQGTLLSPAGTCCQGSNVNNQCCMRAAFVFSTSCELFYLIFTVIPHTKKGVANNLLQMNTHRSPGWFTAQSCMLTKWQTGLRPDRWLSAAAPLSCLRGLCLPIPGP